MDPFSPEEYDNFYNLIYGSETPNPLHHPTLSTASSSSSPRRRSSGEFDPTQLESPPSSSSSYEKRLRLSPLATDFMSLNRQSGDGLELKFEPIPGTQKSHVRFDKGSVEHISSFKVSHNINQANLLLLDDKIDAAFERAVRPCIQNCNPEDIISVTITHSDLSRGPIYLTFRKIKDFSSQKFTNSIYQVTQSNSDFLMDGVFELKVNVIGRATGGAPRGEKRPQNSDETRKLSRSIVDIVSIGNDCGFKAIYLAHLRRKTFGDVNLWRKTIANMRKLYQPAAKRLHKDVQKFVIEVNESQGCQLNINTQLDVSEIAYFAKHLNVRIIVFAVNEDTDTKDAEIIYYTPERHAEEDHIFLELLRRRDGTSHFNLITSPSGYLKCRNFCIYCHSKTERGHKCNSGCPGCKRINTCQAQEEINCENCGQKCLSRTCFLQHKTLKDCKERWKCPICDTELRMREKSSHECSKSFCTSCNKHFDRSPHHCYMRKREAAEAKNVVIVAFDIESMMVDGEHVPNLLCSMTVCDLCYKQENVRGKDESGNYLPLKDGDCTRCKKFVNVFRGTDCVEKFGDYLYNDLARHAAQVEKHTVLRVFAHNFKSYDGRFVLRDFFKRDILDSKAVMQGTKITCFDVSNVRFQDSLNLFMCALKKLPDTFKFSERVKKGDFPHAFNTAENQNYIGQTPALEYYGYDRLKPEDQKTLRAFHDSIKDRMDFNFQNELLTYCLADVEVLLISLMAFRSRFIDVSGFDSIQDHFTLPSMSFATFRQFFLEEETIGITPIKTYGDTRISSIISDCYLDWWEKNSPEMDLVREQKIGIKWADGFDVKTSTVYEFYGCFHHGCTRCFQDDRDAGKRSMNQKYRETMEKEVYYEKMKQVFPNLNLLTMWECEFNRAIQQDPELASFVAERTTYYKKIKEVGHINLRDAYFGGRTENNHFFKQCGPDEWFEIVDFCSLYPAVIAKYPYMVGHPTLINKNFHHYVHASGTILSDNLFGFVKCKVLPPKQMTFPILPGRFNDRLEFVLCGKCGEENAKTFCTHSDEERCLMGTFTTVELREALKEGYRIMEVYEVLQWEKISYRLFSDYIRKWIKVKQEASGYPEWVKTETDKDKYIEDYFQKTSKPGQEGIRLDKDSIRYDNTLRTIAKNQLNSFYGKFAQRPNMEQCEIVKSYAQLHKIVFDAGKEVTGMIYIDDNCALVNYKMVDDDDCSPGNTNVAIAAFITSYARMELWRKINEMDKKSPGCVYYMDTDSIFYVANKDTELLPTGDLLGDLTREIGENEEVKKMVVLGPKNYAYEKRNKLTGAIKNIVKVKGITLDATTRETINIDTMEEMCKKFYETGEVIEKQVEQFRFHSTKDQKITNQILLKTYRAVSEKRLVVGNDTFPKGYVTGDFHYNQRLDNFIAFLETVTE